MHNSDCTVSERRERYIQLVAQRTGLRLAMRGEWLNTFPRKIQQNEFRVGRRETIKLCEASWTISFAAASQPYWVFDNIRDPTPLRVLVRRTPPWCKIEICSSLLQFFYAFLSRSTSNDCYAYRSKATLSSRHIRVSHRWPLL